MASKVSPLQIFVGDLHGLNTLEHQPVKVAAMEAIWDTQRGAPFTVLAWPDEESRSNRFALEIPYATSLALTHELDGEVRGLNDFVDEQLPIPLLCLLAFAVMLHVLYLEPRVFRERSGWLDGTAVVICVTASLGLGYSLFPHVIIDGMTIWEASASVDSLLFTLVGIVLTLPMILVYTVYLYRIFRGKATALSYE